MKKEEKEEIAEQKKSNRTLKRGIVAGAAGVAGAGVGYAASHIDDILPADSDEVIADVDSADNEDGSFFEKIVSFGGSGSHAHASAGNAPAAHPSVEHDEPVANGTEEPVSVEIVSEPEEHPVAQDGMVEPHGDMADAVADITIDDYDISAPSADDPMPDMADADNFDDMDSDFDA